MTRQKQSARVHSGAGSTDGGIANTIIRGLGMKNISETLWKWRCKIYPPKTADDTRENGGSKDDKADAGGDPVAKTMYEGPDSKTWNYNWVEYPPRQISQSTAREHGRVAIKAFKVKDHEKQCISGRLPLKYHSIQVQNLALVAALAPIFKKQDLHLSESEAATFSAPFHVLFFCEDEIRQLYAGMDKTDVLRPYLKLFIDTVESVLTETHKKLENLSNSGLVSFAAAWSLFPRGTTVYSRDLESEFLCKVAKAEYVTKSSGTTDLIITAKVLRFDGESFVWTSKVLILPQFQGNKPVKMLKHRPVQYCSDLKVLYARLTERGKNMLDLQGLRYRVYNNVALYWGKDEMYKHNVEGRILIDVAGYQKYQDNELHRTKRKSSRKRNEEEDNEDDWGVGAWDEYDSGSDDGNDDDSDYDSDSSSSDGNAPVENRALRKQISVAQCVRNKEMMLRRKDDLPYIYGLVGGYALKTKLWVEFYIEDIEPMVWNDTAYTHLVYDEQQKDLILSFVQHHNSIATANATEVAGTNSNDSSSSTNVSSSAEPDTGNAAPSRKLAPIEDVIIGKGQGLVILLSGPPGTGKTLMAEAVADRTHRPLVYLQAEDLGTHAGELGTRLKKCLTMAAEWNAVVLLDEADVFMAERDPNNIHRNELVSIFLRELEYFRGILFLTTNLYRTIDAAFRSRVSLHLLFSALSRDAREQVWRNFLTRLKVPKFAKLGEASGKEKEAMGESDIGCLSEADLKQISLWELNGREIKNAVKMVRTWCDYKGYVMSLEKLESGIRVTNPRVIKGGDVDKDLYD